MSDQVRQFKLVMKVKDVPAGSTVVKLRGACHFTVSDEIKVWIYPKPKGSKGKTMTPPSGTRYMISEEGAIYEADKDAEVIWLADEVDLRRLIWRNNPPSSLRNDGGLLCHD